MRSAQFCLSPQHIKQPAMHAQQVAKLTSQQHQKTGARHHRTTRNKITPTRMTIISTIVAVGSHRPAKPQVQSFCWVGAGTGAAESVTMGGLGDKAGDSHRAGAAAGASRWWKVFLPGCGLSNGGALACCSPAVSSESVAARDRPF